MRLYRYLGLIAVLLMVDIVSSAQTIRYSPMWFGPYAQPIPQLREAEISSMPVADAIALTSISRVDRSLASYLDVEVPFLSKAASIRLYGYLLDAYDVSPEVAALRGMEGGLRGAEVGDLYLQTRIRVLREGDNIRPNLILNITLKTASPRSVVSRRSFDTPGYYFHLEGGKDFSMRGSFIHTLRLNMMAGFMCWETGGSLQNDAYLYGLSLTAKSKKLSATMELSGYTGWMHFRYGEDYGDRPVSVRGTISYGLSSRLSLQARYEHGLRDYPHQVLGIGLRWNMPWDISKLLK